MFRRRRSADVGRDWPSELEDGQDWPTTSSTRRPTTSRPRTKARGGSASRRRPVGRRGGLPAAGPGRSGQPAGAGRPGARDPARHGRPARRLGNGPARRQRDAGPGVRRGPAGRAVGRRPGRDRHRGTRRGRDSEETEGSFGTELMAQVPAEPGQPASGLRLVRFIGVDGPRWFLRGLFSGPAASGGESAPAPARGDLQGRRGGARRAPGAAARHPGTAAASGGPEGVRGAGRSRRRTGSRPT